MKKAVIQGKPSHGTAAIKIKMEIDDVILFILSSKFFFSSSQFFQKKQGKEFRPWLIAHWPLKKKEKYFPIIEDPLPDYATDYYFMPQLRIFRFDSYSHIIFFQNISRSASPKPPCNPRDDVIFFFQDARKSFLQHIKKLQWIVFSTDPDDRLNFPFYFFSYIIIYRCEYWRHNLKFLRGWYEHSRSF